MERAKVIRGLRIALTTVFGILSVLLLVLWVRSYWWREWINRNAAASATSLTASSGVVTFRYLGPQFQGQPFLNDGWSYGRSGRLGGDDLGQFQLVWQPPYVIVKFPIWVAVFAAVTLAIIAGAPWLRHLKRFSLRTLLIATTLLAVLLGLVAWGMQN